MTSLDTDVVDFIRASRNINRSWNEIQDVTGLEMSEIAAATFTNEFSSHIPKLEPEQRKPWEDVELIQGLMKENMFYQEIAELLECHPETVRHWVRRVTFNKQTLTVHVDGANEINIQAEGNTATFTPSAFKNNVLLDKFDYNFNPKFNKSINEEGKEKIEYEDIYEKLNNNRDMTVTFEGIVAYRPLLNRLDSYIPSIKLGSDMFLLPNNIEENISEEYYIRNSSTEMMSCSPIKKLQQIQEE